MEIRVFQIIVPAIALLLMLVMLVRYSRGRVTFGEMILTAAFWLGVAAVAVWPDRISKTVARVFGIESNVNAIIFLSIGVLLYLIFRLYNEMRLNRRQVTELARKIALLEAEKEEP